MSQIFPSRLISHFWNFDHENEQNSFLESNSSVYACKRREIYNPYLASKTPQVGIKMLFRWIDSDGS